MVQALTAKIVLLKPRSRDVQEPAKIGSQIVTANTLVRQWKGPARFRKHCLHYSVFHRSR